MGYSGCLKKGKDKISVNPAIMCEVRSKRAMSADVVLGAAEQPLQMHLLKERRDKVQEISFNLKNATKKIVGRAIAEIRILNIAGK